MITTIIMIAACVDLFLYGAFFFHNRLQKKVKTIVSIGALTLTVVEETGMLLIPYLEGKDAAFMSKNMLNIVMMGLVKIILSSGIAILSLVMKRILKQKLIKLRTIIIFLLFPISQCMMITGINKSIYQEKNAVSIMCLLGMTVFLTTDMYLYYILFEQSSIGSMKSQLKKASLSLETERKNLKIQEEQEQEVEALKGELLERLLHMKESLYCGEDVSTEASLKEMTETLQNSKNTCFCSDSVINAVLTAELKKCVDSKITLDTQIEVYKEVPIDPVTICSIYSNLIDNAIHASAQCKEQNRFISVKTKMNGDYLTIKVENTVPDKIKKEEKIRKHYGQLIIDDIVKKYNGEWHFKISENVYTAVVSIMMKEG